MTRRTFVTIHPSRPGGDPVPVVASERDSETALTRESSGGTTHRDGWLTTSSIGGGGRLPSVDQRAPSRLALAVLVVGIGLTVAYAMAPRTVGSEGIYVAAGVLAVVATVGGIIATGRTTPPPG